MAPSRILAVLLVATLAVTSSGFDFAGENDITQSTGTVAPGIETQVSSTGSYDSPNQWTQTASSSNNVPAVVPNAPSSVSGSRGWTPSTTDAWTSPRSGDGNQGWSPPTSTDASSSATSEYSLECSGSDENATPTTDYSLECSGSDETTDGSQPTVSTSTSGSSNLTPTTTTTPTTSSRMSDQASSSNTVTSAPSSGYRDVVDQSSSQAAQTPSVASSSNTAQSPESSSNTAQSNASSSRQEGSDVTQTSTNSTSSGEHATFGAVTFKPGECIIGKPDNSKYFIWTIFRSSQKRSTFYFVPGQVI
ncbi:hypothetical protein GN958_ATG21626 [Phytophthora infestans]|uniref:Uncharacterized protein n=1 Tax=Phytophthora infestans TaxID=4787 RepID=A0A8S9TJQ5_PHYIN|nr:hypothetical protein GN958_ATG21626 [Phytophthora infestans]